MQSEIKANSIVCCDVLDGLSRIADNSIHLVLCSPPFNVKIPYPNHDDFMPHSAYLSWMKSVWKECHRVLVHGGRICINIDATMNLDASGDALIERVHPLHVDFTNQLRELGYIYRAEVTWTKQNAPGKDTAWGSYMLPSNPHIRRNCEHVVIASKGTLTLAGDPMMSDLAKQEFHEWTLSEWKITPETQKSHPAPFPRELARRCIKLFSYVGNVVLDPFNGSGTTTEVAFEHGRQYIGLDNYEGYCEQARSRIKYLSQSIQPYQFTPSPVAQSEHRKSKKQVRRDIFV